MTQLQLMNTIFGIVALSGITAILLHIRAKLFRVGNFY